MDALSGRSVEGRKTVTVLFCDLVAYTELAERLDPEALPVLMLRFFERVGRGVPDVAGNADPHTGWLVGDGMSDHPFGGTSAPLWTALVAQLNQHLGARAGFINPLLYEHLDRSVFNDVPRGGNGAYRARRGRWDACTGHGTPRGRALLDALSA